MKKETQFWVRFRGTTNWVKMDETEYRRLRCRNTPATSYGDILDTPSRFVSESIEGRMCYGHPDSEVAEQQARDLFKAGFEAGIAAAANYLTKHPLIITVSENLKFSVDLNDEIKAIRELECDQ